MNIKKCIICEKNKNISLFCNYSEIFSDRCISCHYKIHKKQLKNKEKKLESSTLEVTDTETISIEIDYINYKKERKNKRREYPKEFSDKRRILLDNARKNDWCTACGAKELLQVHHIDHNKFNNEDKNLIVLCYYCHSKEHKHMQWKKPPKWLK